MVMMEGLGIRFAPTAVERRLMMCRRQQVVGRRLLERLRQGVRTTGGGPNLIGPLETKRRGLLGGGSRDAYRLGGVLDTTVSCVPINC